MNIRKYTESDSDWIELDNFTSATEPPSEGTFEEYKTTIEQAHNHALDFITIPDQVTIIVGERTRESTQNALETEFGRKSVVSAYSFPEDYYEWITENTILICSSQAVEFWEGLLKSAVVHELAHQMYFDQQPTVGDEQIHSIFFEAHAMATAKLAVDRYDYGYTSPWRPEEPLDIDANKLKESLYRERVLTTETGKNIGDLFSARGRWPNNEGYAISYQIGRWMVTDRNPSIQVADIPRLTDEQQETIIYEAIEHLYE